MPDRAKQSDPYLGTSPKPESPALFIINCMAHLRAKRISKWLEEMAMEPHGKSREPRNKLIAQTLYELALDPKQPAKVRLDAINMIADRLDGKPVQTSVNAEMTVSPFDGIDTARLEALKAQLEQVTDGK